LDADVPLEPAEDVGLVMEDLDEEIPDDPDDPGETDDPETEVPAEVEDVDDAEIAEEEDEEEDEEDDKEDEEEEQSGGRYGSRVMEKPGPAIQFWVPNLGWNTYCVVWVQLKEGSATYKSCIPSMSIGPWNSLLPALSPPHSVHMLGHRSFGQ
jgi:hypothetical protein